MFQKLKLKLFFLHYPELFLKDDAEANILVPGWRIDC
jgi:hypothetical protein